MPYLLIVALLFISCQQKPEQTDHVRTEVQEKKIEITPLPHPKNFGERLSNAALQVIDSTVVYTPACVSIPYPIDRKSTRLNSSH